MPHKEGKTVNKGFHRKEGICFECEMYILGL